MSSLAFILEALEAAQGTMKTQGAHYVGQCMHAPHTFFLNRSFGSEGGARPKQCHASLGIREMYGLARAKLHRYALP